MGNGWRLNRLLSPQTSSFDGFYLTQRLRTQIGYPTGTELVLAGSRSFSASVFLSVFFFPPFLGPLPFAYDHCLFLFALTLSFTLLLLLLQNTWGDQMTESSISWIKLHFNFLAVKLLNKMFFSDLTAIIENPSGDNVITSFMSEILHSNKPPLDHVNATLNDPENI